MPRNRQRRRDKKVGGGGAARPAQGSSSDLQSVTPHGFNELLSGV